MKEKYLKGFMGFKGRIKDNNLTNRTHKFSNFGKKKAVKINDETNPKQVLITNLEINSLVIIARLSESSNFALYASDVSEGTTEFHVIHGNKEVMKMFIRIWYPLIIIFGVTGNAMIFSHLFRQRKTKGFDNRLLMTMTLCDIAMLLNYPVVRFVLFAFNFALDAISDATCFIQNFLFFMTMDTSIFILSFLSVFRLISIKYPLRQIRIFTTRNMTIIFSLSGIHIIIKAVMGSISESEGHEEYGRLCKIKYYKETGIYHFIYFIINYALLAISNFSTLKTIRRVMRSHDQVDCPTTDGYIMARILMALSFLFFICGLPMFAFFILTFVVEYELGDVIVLESLFAAVYFTNYALNVVAFVVSSKTFRKDLITITKSFKIFSILKINRQKILIPISNTTWFEYEDSNCKQTYSSSYLSVLYSGKKLEQLLCDQNTDEFSQL